MAKQAGILGGGLGGQILAMLGAGGAVLLAIVGAIKSAMGKSG